MSFLKICPPFRYLFRILELGLPLASLFSISLSIAGPPAAPDKTPYASGAKTPSDPNQQLNDPEFGECGPDCLYGKAQENIGNQSLFILQKNDYVINALNRLNGDPEQGSAGDPAAEGELQKVLGTFCGKTESTKSCANRYLNLNRFWLAKARNAVLQNQIHQSELKCLEFGKDGTCTKFSNAAPILQGKTQEEMNQSSKKFSQAGYFSKFTDLKKEAAANGKINNVKDNWLNDFKPDKDCSDFIKFKEIPRDPNQTELGKIKIPERGADGKFVYDMKACKDAKDAWGLYEDTFKDENKKMNKETLARRKQGIDDMVKNDDAKRGSNGWIYNQSRKVYVDFVNHQLGQATPQNKNNQSKVGAKPSSQSNSNSQAKPNEPPPNFKESDGSETVKYREEKQGEMSNFSSPPSMNMFQREANYPVKAPAAPTGTQPNNPGNPATNTNPANTKPDPNKKKPNSPDVPNPKDIPHPSLQINDSQDLFFDYNR